MTKKLSEIIQDAQQVEGKVYLYLCADYDLDDTDRSTGIFNTALSEILAEKREHWLSYCEGFTTVSGQDLTSDEKIYLEGLAANELKEKGFEPDYLSVDILIDSGNAVNLGIYLGNENLNKYSPEFIESLISNNLIILGIVQEGSLKPLAFYESNGDGSYQQRKNDVKGYQLPPELI